MTKYIITGIDEDGDEVSTVIQCDSADAATSSYKRYHPDWPIVNIEAKPDDILIESYALDWVLTSPHITLQIKKTWTNLQALQVVNQWISEGDAEPICTCGEEDCPNNGGFLLPYEEYKDIFLAMTLELIEKIK